MGSEENDDANPFAGIISDEEDSDECEGEER